MARVVNMGALLPDDIEFRLPGPGAKPLKVLAPGDAPFDLVAKIAMLFDAAQEANQQIKAAGGDVAKVQEAGADGFTKLQELDQLVLELLRLRDPNIKRQPFGLVGLTAFVGELLAQYRIVSRDGATDPTPGS